jgi:hypothetical protein
VPAAPGTRRCGAGGCASARRVCPLRLPDPGATAAPYQPSRADARGPLGQGRPRWSLRFLPRAADRSRRLEERSQSVPGPREKMAKALAVSLGCAWSKPSPRERPKHPSCRPRAGCRLTGADLPKPCFGHEQSANVTAGPAPARFRPSLDPL